MDTAGGVAIFQRPIERYGLRYVELLQDGDSKASSIVIGGSSATLKVVGGPLRGPLRGSPPITILP